MNQAHEQIAHMSAVLGLIEECIFSMQDRLFQSALAEVVVEWGAGYAQEQGQFLKMVDHVGDGLAETGVGLDLALGDLLGEPVFKLLHQGGALGM